MNDAILGTIAIFIGAAALSALIYIAFIVLTFIWPFLLIGLVAVVVFWAGLLLVAIVQSYAEAVRKKQREEKEKEA